MAAKREPKRAQKIGCQATGTCTELHDFAALRGVENGRDLIGQCGSE